MTDHVDVLIGRSLQPTKRQLVPSFTFSIAFRFQNGVAIHCGEVEYVVTPDNQTKKICKEILSKSWVCYSGLKQQEALFFSCSHPFVGSQACLPCAQFDSRESVQEHPPKRRIFHEGIHWKANPGPCGHSFVGAALVSPCSPGRGWWMWGGGAEMPKPTPCVVRGLCAGPCPEPVQMMPSRRRPQQAAVRNPARQGGGSRK